jgi:hypothetical protein
MSVVCTGAAENGLTANEHVRVLAKIQMGKTEAVHWGGKTTASEVGGVLNQQWAGRTQRLQPKAVLRASKHRSGSSGVGCHTRGAEDTHSMCRGRG